MWTVFPGYSVIVEIRTTAPARAPADVVWERYTRFDRWPTWAPQITGVEVSSTRIATGATGRVRGPLGISAPFVVTDVDADQRTWAWTVTFLTVRLRLRHGVDPDGGTWLVIQGPAPLVLGYLPMARLALCMLTRP